MSKSALPQKRRRRAVEPSTETSVSGRGVGIPYIIRSTPQVDRSRKSAPTAELQGCQLGPDAVPLRYQERLWIRPPGVFARSLCQRVGPAVGTPFARLGRPPFAAASAFHRGSSMRCGSVLATDCICTRSESTSACGNVTQVSQIGSPLGGSRRTRHQFREAVTAQSMHGLSKKAAPPTTVELRSFRDTLQCLNLLAGVSITQN